MSAEAGRELPSPTAHGQERKFTSVNCPPDTGHSPPVIVQPSAGTSQLTLKWANDQGTEKCAQCERVNAATAPDPPLPLRPPYLGVVSGVLIEDPGYFAGRRVSDSASSTQRTGARVSK